MFRKCIVLAVILAMIFSLSACGLVPTKAPTKPPTPGTPPTTTKELEGIKITVTDLYDEYEVNEIAADHKYKNRTITVAGVIADISRDPQSNKPYVSVGGYTLSELVRCFFDKEDQLLSLAVEEEIIIKGKCLGKKEEKEGTSFPILLENCYLVEETEFQLVDWKLTKRGLEISFTKFGYPLHYFLKDPKGNEISGEEAGHYAEQWYPYTCLDTEGKVYFGLGGMPSGGGYKLVVKDKRGKIVATKTFNFSGASPEVEILDYKFGLFSDKFSLYLIKFSIKNIGDLPFHLGDYLEVMNGESSAFYTFPRSMELFPGEEGILEANAYALNYGLLFPSPGEQRVTLNFRESGKEAKFEGAYAIYEYGRVVYSMNATINVPEKSQIK